MTTNNLSKAAAALGRKGGSATSEAKRAAARTNGRKGGRPTETELRIRNQIDDIRDRLTELSLAGKSDTERSNNLKRREMRLWARLEKLTYQGREKFKPQP
jgi:hypothetical protein